MIKKCAWWLLIMIVSGRQGITRWLKPSLPMNPKSFFSTNESLIWLVSHHVFSLTKVFQVVKPVVNPNESQVFRKVHWDHPETLRIPHRCSSSMATPGRSRWSTWPNLGHQEMEISTMWGPPGNIINFPRKYHKFSHNHSKYLVDNYNVRPPRYIDIYHWYLLLYGWYSYTI